MPLSRKKGNQAEGAARAKAPPCGSLPGMFEDGEKARTVSWEKQDGGTEVSGSRGHRTLQATMELWSLLQDEGFKQSSHVIRPSHRLLGAAM